MTLDVFDGIELPDEFVTQPCGVLARRGAGKTYTTLKIAEELVGAGLPLAVLDPLGVCWGLRAAADGKKPGLPVKILGGEHGDVPLEPTGGRVVAQFVVDHPGAYVVDLSSFESGAAQDRFAGDFAESLYRAKNRDRAPLHLIVDEADSFAPQKPFPNQKRMLGAFEAIVRRGRSRGLGVTLVSQRPAVLNKNVLSQIEVLVALQVTAPQDRAALKDWAVGFSTKVELDEFLAGLATLAVGDAWVWSPQWLGVFARTRVKARWTFDSSATPKAGETKIEPRVMADVDLDVLKAEMAETIERAEADDPRRLRARIADLERDLTVKPAEIDVERIVDRDVPVLTDEHLFAIENLDQALGDATSMLEAVNGQLSDVEYALGQAKKIAEPILTAAREGLRAAAEQIAAFGVPVEQARAARAPRETPRQPVAAARPDPDVPAGDDGYRPRAGARRMLEALARYPAGLTVAQTATHAGIKRTSGTFSTYLSELRRNGLVDSGGNGLVATGAGVAAVGGVPLPTDPSELRNEWRDRLKARGAKAMFDELVGRYPAGATRSALADLVGLSASSGTFSTYLSRLRSNGLIEELGDEVRAHPDLFLGENR